MSRRHYERERERDLNILEERLLVFEERMTVFRKVKIYQFCAVCVRCGAGGVGEGTTGSVRRPPVGRSVL